MSFHLNTKSLSPNTFPIEFANRGKSVSWYVVSIWKRSIEQFIFHSFFVGALITRLSFALQGKATVVIEKNHQEKYNKGGQQWIH